jgi:ribokinase
MPPQPASAPRIVVVGSCMLDLIAQVDLAPERGETVLGQRLDTQPGGKGFNQAIAAARLGCSVDLVARVGDDDHGRLFLDTLDRNAIGRAHVSTDPDQGTGMSMVIVDADGENRIVATPRANHALTPALIADASASLGQAGALLLSFEVPLDVLTAAAALAGPQTLVCLNAAPAAPIPDELAARTDVLIVNEVEAATLSGAVVDSIDAAQCAADRLRAFVRRAVVITLGELGAVYAEDGASGHAPAFDADVRDTTGAGDAFCAALAFGLASGHAIRDAVVLGNAAGSLAVRTPGAAPAMPAASAVLALAASR